MNYFSRKNPQILHAVDKFLIIMITIIDVAVLPSVGDRLQLHDMMSNKQISCTYMEVESEKTY